MEKTRSRTTRHPSFLDASVLLSIFQAYCRGGEAAGCESTPQVGTHLSQPQCQRRTAALLIPSTSTLSHSSPFALWIVVTTMVPCTASTPSDSFCTAPRLGVNKVDERRCKVRGQIRARQPEGKGTRLLGKHFVLLA